MSKIKKFIKKENNTKLKLIIAIILSVIISLVYNLKIKNQFVVDRFIIISLFNLFICLHFIIKLDKIYNFIYKYRYYIAGATLIIATVFGYSGSSIGIYNDLVQNEDTNKYYTPILGKYRAIRSDEWTVNTPIFISQCKDKDHPFAYYNDNLRGTKTDMFTIVAPPVNDVLLLARPFNIGFLLFGAARGLSILWFGKWIALALVTFEFFMMITDKKKLLSFCGAILVFFSAATQWWNWIDLVTWGLLALVLLDKYLKESKISKKILYAFGIFISAISFVFIMYPAWQIPYIYIYLALFISMCIKNRKEYKLSKKDIPIILCVFLAIAGIGLRYLKLSQDALKLTMNTAYPGKRFEIGGGGIGVLFSYVYSYLFPYTQVDNPCERAGMISFYPIPTIIAIIYLIRNKDRKQHLAFLLPLLILSFVFSIFAITKTNSVFAKFTFLYITTGSRIAVPLGFIQILILIYLLSIVDNKKIMSNKLAIIVSVLSSIIIFRIAIKTGPANYFGALRSYCMGLILLTFIYLLFTMNIKENRKILVYSLIVMALITGATVNPIQRGISVLTDKPIAKEVQKIVNENSENNLWITESAPNFLSNYILANGARIVNSTNTYPNWDLYRTILGEDYNKEENTQIFNRYAHISIEITTDENKVELLYPDSIKIYITPDKIKELGINYIVTTRDIDNFETDNVKFSKLYEEQGLLIYNVD